MAKFNPAEIIESKRSFGVELEVVNAANRAGELAEAVQKWASTKSDGSIQGPNPREVVTAPLREVSGGNKIVQICQAIKKLGYHGDHETCGMHVHFGAEDFLNKTKSIVVEKDGLESFLKEKANSVSSKAFINDNVTKTLYKTTTPGSVIKTYNYLKGNIFVGNPRRLESDRSAMVRVVDDVRIVDVVNDEDHQMFDILRRKKRRTVFDGNLSDIEAHEALVKIDQWYKKTMDTLVTIKDGKYVVEVSDNQVTNRIKNLLLFYYVFEPVILGMTAPSRKEKNAYCQKITESFEIEDIVGCQSYRDFQKLWYKEKNDGGINRHISNHYDDSRYHFVNFHSLWDRTGTIELRCHGGTVDELQVLLWTALNQKIIDTVASGKVNAEQLMAINELPADDKVSQMLEIIDANEKLRKYVIKMYNHFTKLCVD